MQMVKYFRFYKSLKPGYFNTCYLPSGCDYPTIVTFLNFRFILKAESVAAVVFSIEP